MRSPGVWWLLSRACLLLLPPCALVLARVPGSSSHPQPCQILKRIGHTVRIGATHLQPWLARPRAITGGWGPPHGGVGVGGAGAGQAARAARAAGGQRRRPAGSPRGRAGERAPEASAGRELVLLPREALLAAVESLNRARGLLPYNLSLEVVMAIEAGLGDLPLLPFSSPSSAWSSDPVSFLHSLCHTVVVQGVSAILAFPQSRGEMLELDFVASALRIPVLSVVLHEFPRKSQVRGAGRGAGGGRGS